MTEIAADLPFRAEYAKSNRSSCRGCRLNIDQGTFRMAVMVQSPHFDGKVPNWYHFGCFWKRSRVQTVADIQHFDNMRLEDQERIREKIASGASSVVTEGRKNAEYTDFLVELAASGGSKCRICEEKIGKNMIRMGVKDYVSEQAKIYGPQKRWHHLDCFIPNREKLGFDKAKVTEMLNGFKRLPEDHRNELLEKLGRGDKKAEKRKLNEAVKKSKSDAKKSKAENPEDAEVAKQTKLLWQIRDAIENEGALKKKELTLWLEFNKQSVPSGYDKVLDAVVDGLAFGALKPCPECQGQLVHSSTANGYRCTGDMTEWSSCLYVTQTPERSPWRVPKEFKQLSQLCAKYKYVERTRVYRSNREQSTAAKQRTEAGEEQPLIVPTGNKLLSGMTFVLVGRGGTTKAALEKMVKPLGGEVKTQVTPLTVAVITNEHEVEKMSSKIKDAKQNGIHCVPVEFIEKVTAGSKQELSRDQVFALLDEMNLASWGDPAGSRVKVEGHLSVKSGAASSNGTASGKSKSKSTSKSGKLQMKAGGVVDPDSGLQDVAHVYEDEKHEKYSSTLALVDIGSGTNSYYKLQLLESDHSKRWWLFRAWGRTGTTIGDNKLEDFRNVNNARAEFERIFFEKTGNEWADRSGFVKRPRKFYPVDVDFSPDDGLASKLNDDMLYESKLAAEIQDLIKRIFDVESMRKTMLEFEIDLEKMPLGKLSKKQLQNAYGVLNELQEVIENDGSNEARLLDLSQRFYTLIPHNFGMERPPLIDNMKMVQDKCEMIDNLLEIELACSLLRTDADGADATASPIDIHYSKLNNKIDVLHPTSEEFVRITEMVKNTHASTHNMYELEVMEVLSCDRHGESERFEKKWKSLHNRQMLWHGSRVTNLAGILSEGLRIAPPEAPITGYMFGKGIYFADLTFFSERIEAVLVGENSNSSPVSKSANYLHTNQSNPIGYLLLCEVALGDVQEERHAKEIKKPKKGKHSVKGVGKTAPNPSEQVVTEDGLVYNLGKPVLGNTDGDFSLQYNEFIVYDASQVRMRYLVKLNFKWKY